jgi:chromosome segregation ATPase
LETEKQSQTEISQLLERLHKLETSYSQLKETCASGQSAHRENDKTLQELQSQLSDSYTVAENMRGAIQSLDAMNKQLKEELCSLRNETTKERQELHQIKKQFAEVQSENKKLQKENRDLSESLITSRKDLKRTRLELQRISGQHSNYTRAIKQLQDDLAEKERQSNIKTLSEHKLEIKIQQLEERCSGLSCELEETLKQVDVTRSGKSGLEHLVKTLDAENASLTDQLEKSNFERMSLLENIGKLTDEVSDLKARLKLHSGRSPDFAEYVKLKREVVELRNQTEQLMKQRSQDATCSSPDRFRLLGRPIQKRASFSRVLSITASQHRFVETGPAIPGVSRMT